MTQTAQAPLTPWQPVKEPTWRRFQAKRAFEIVLGKMLQPEHKNPGDDLVPYLRALNVQWERLKLEEIGRMWAAPQEIEALELKQGDLLVCEGGEVGRAARIDVELPENTIIQNALHRVRGSDLGDVGYLSYCLRHAVDAGWFEVICNRATIAHFTVEKFRDLWLNLPDLPTQRRIADFLDRATAQIDALIEAKEQMLALLQEKRAAQISHMVTKGLDPNAEMKDSGLEWLGEIPKHWEVRRLKNLTQEIQTGPFGSQIHAEEYVEAGVPLINPADITPTGINYEKVAKVTEETAERLGRHAMQEGDVILARRGEIGRNFVITALEEGWLCGTGCLRLRTIQEFLLPDYFSAIMVYSPVPDYLRSLSVGSTMDNLNTEMLSELFIPIPPISEQQAIVNSIDAEGSEILTLSEMLNSSISLLRERRSALITAAVTGQLAEVLE